jgi:preprotein translocase subunit SecG
MSWLPYLSMTALAFVGVLLIFIILLQRGRGGGLTGALGGMGGQSAFGTKAGDVFTRITIGLALIWVLMAIANVYIMSAAGTKWTGGAAADVPTAPALTPDKTATDETATDPADATTPAEGAATPAGAAGDKEASATGEAATKPADPQPAEAATTPATPADQPAAETPAPAATTEAPAESAKPE